MSNIGADASTVRLAFKKEDEWADEATSPEFHYIRQTGNGLVPTLNKTASSEITGNRGKSDIITTQGGAEGDINFEPSYGYMMDAFFEQSLSGLFDNFGVLNAGTETESMWFEQQTILPTGAIDYNRYAGSRVNSLALTLDATSTEPITGTINIMARSEDDDTAALSGATYVDADENPIMSMPEMRFVKFYINGVEHTACFTMMSFTVSANTEMQQGKCTASTSYPDINAKGIGYADREIQITSGTYYNGLDFSAMFKANTAGSMSYILTDGVRGYKVTFPNVKVLESSIPKENGSAALIQDMTLQALIGDNDTDMTIEKIGALTGGYQLTGDPITPAATVGNYYTDGSTQENGEDVLYSVNGTYAIWYDGSDTLLTTVADVGEVAPTTIFSVTGSFDPEGTWVAGTGTGTLTGAAYDPTA